MRKLILFIFGVLLLAACSHTVRAQSFNTTSHNGMVWDRYWIFGSLAVDVQNNSKTDSNAYAPYNASFQAGRTGMFKGTIINTPADHDLIPAPVMGMVAFDTTEKYFYGHNGLNWVRLDSVSAGGGSGVDKPYVDSAVASVSAGAVNWAAIIGKPTEFPPEAHTHPQSEVTGLVNDLAGKSDTGHTHDAYIQKTDYIVTEFLTGATNGSNTTFTCTYSPVVGTGQLYRNGMIQRPGAGHDYTISGNTISTLFTAQTGEQLLFTYIKQ